jgi:hypothetical protein
MKCVPLCALLWGVIRISYSERTNHLEEGSDLFCRARISCKRFFSMATPARAAWDIFCAIQQKVKCEGCNSTVSVPAEPRWYYRLNSLVRNGIAFHGCIAVISALHSLRQRARESFIYTHGATLFRDYNDELPEAEVDLLCISDGKLICGEVKSSASEFTREDLAKLVGVAEAIRADLIAISAFNDPNGLMKKHFQTLATMLPVGCGALICGPNPFAFQPQPHVF